MTLEAALIVPMIICVFALLIYFSFYLYGRCVISQDSYILAFRASTARFGGDDPGGYVASKAASQAGRKYFGSSFPSFETQVSCTSGDLPKIPRTYIELLSIESHIGVMTVVTFHSSKKLIVELLTAAVALCIFCRQLL